MKGGLRPIRVTFGRSGHIKSQRSCRLCASHFAVAVELLPPFHHVAFAAVFLDQPVNVIHASAAAFGALDTERRGISLMEP
jgi:hypothetical protein